MRRFRFLVLGAFLLAAPIAAHAGSAEAPPGPDVETRHAQATDADRARCEANDRNTVIAGCTAVLARGERETQAGRVSAFENRGAAYDDAGDHLRAVADFSQAIALAPDSAAAYNNRGLAYVNMGDNDRAIADYDVADRLTPNDAAILTNRGTAYHD